MGSLGRLYNWPTNINNWKDWKITNGVAIKMDIKSSMKSNVEAGESIVFLMLLTWLRKELEIGTHPQM